MSREYKPCPYCGSESEDWDDHDPGCYARLMNEMVFSPWCCSDENHGEVALRKAWNTRAESHRNFDVLAEIAKDMYAFIVLNEELRDVTLHGFHGVTWNRERGSRSVSRSWEWRWRNDPDASQEKQEVARLRGRHPTRPCDGCRERVCRRYSIPSRERPQSRIQMDSRECISRCKRGGHHFACPRIYGRGALGRCRRSRMGEEDVLRLYVIGPVTGRERDNIEAFYEAQDALDKAGHSATIPHEFIGSDTPREKAMLASINELTDIIEDWDTRPWFDGVAMLDGWERSKGATLEHAVAEACGIPCKPWREWLE